MARKKKSTTETAPAEAHTIEQLSDEQLQTLFFQHKRKIKGLAATEKLAKQALKEAYALAKAEGISKKELEIAMALESEEGEEKARADADRIFRVARWMGVAIGTQGELFNGDAKKQFDAGKRAAMDDQPRKPPSNLSQDDAQDWMEGHDEGRIAVNVSRAAQFKPLGDAPSTIHHQ